MPLEIRHNRAEHAHENFQFRRIVKTLKLVFEEKGWDGLLIGNPESEVFPRFRADAILLYNYGLLVIDLKNYEGEIVLPIDDTDFKRNTWYIDTKSDKARIEIKGGARFANPFKQLVSYRDVMYEVIRANPILKANLNPSRTCAINLFSGPIKLNRKVPGALPYYKIVQESDLFKFLYDFNSKNEYSEETANSLKTIFPTEEWDECLPFEFKDEVYKGRIIEIDNNVKGEITSFLKSEESGILVLESMESLKRDEWAHYILSEGISYNIPQIEPWTHSTRIQRKIKVRSGINPASLFNTIYGGKSRLEDGKIVDALIEPEDENEDLKDIIPLRSDEILDERAVVILQDAHLISRSLHQSELLRFGTGRLLEDLMTFLSLENTNRKLICIGDPYSLSYGKESESAISIETLKELFNGKIQHYRDEPAFKDGNEINKLRSNLASSINSELFNSLKYNWNENDLFKPEHTEVLALLKTWFSEPLGSQPTNAVLLFSNELAKKSNLWIKNNCLKNSSNLAKDDLLLLNNNVSIPDETGFGNPSRLYNGMYLRVLSLLDEKTESVIIKKSKPPINLRYVKLKVLCLSLENKQEAEIWLNKTYFEGNGSFTKEEQIASKILISLKLKNHKEKFPFSESFEYREFKQDNFHVSLNKKIKELELELKSGGRVKTLLTEAKSNLKRLERKYQKRYNHMMLIQVSSNDPILNAVNASYGWCITVHKSIGTQFNNIIINATQSENGGVNNANYFRWLYSGITTSKSKVYLANPIEFNPFMNCQFEDSVDDGWEEKSKKKKGYDFPNFSIPKKYDIKLNSDLNGNSKVAIYLFSKSIDKDGILFKRTRKQGDYLCKAFFSTPNNLGEITMAFNNNKEGLVTSIRAEMNGGPYERFISKAIEFIEEHIPKEEIESEAIPTDFRKPVYAELMDVCSKKGCEFKLLESKPYQDILQFEKGKEKIRFRMYYNGKGMFSSITVLEKTNSNISIELHELLLNDE
ncbi:NERD domain-containing protein [uncultured Lutibacter sp.]|uniref:NERD domain-containing protein n=1 Tax=uncultured Lutibacter sp. TaxID=437739 RepID=UPI002637A8A0|nr:NERD domain-containing protein [uncultured Lutibacter sp.]